MDAANKNIAWASSGPAVAAIEGNGAIIAVVPLAPGEATITVTTEDGRKTATCAVTVVPALVRVTGVTLDKRSMSLTTGGATGDLTATVLPANATDRGVAWSSSDTAVATVSGNGANALDALSATVTPVAVGTATITVTTVDGAKTAACVVTVGPPVVYMSGWFGVFANGERDTRFNDENDLLVGVAADSAGDVHAAGNWYVPDRYIPAQSLASWHKNGERSVLEMNHGDNDRNTYATGMCIDGTDVYVAGHEHWYSGSFGTQHSPKVWKNGEQQYLQSMEGVSDEAAYANTVRVHNGDVYAAGRTDIVDGYDRAVIWKNGDEHIARGLKYLWGMEVDGWEVKDIGVASNGLIYALTLNFWASYWEIDLWRVWEVQPDLDTWSEVSGLGGSYLGDRCLFVEGDDWYVAGYEGDDGFYLKNGGPPTMMMHGPDQWYVEPNRLFVLNGDVYVAGRAADADDHQSMSILLWKNGQLVTGPGAVAEKIRGYENAEVRGLFVR
jgi:hypothetical protein